MDADAITLVTMTDLDQDGLRRVLSIRNQDAVRANMYTSRIIREDEHLAWAEGLNGASDTRAYAVEAAGEIVGASVFKAVDPDNGTADWGFYVDAARQGQGLGTALGERSLTMAFADLGLRKLSCEVLGFNAASLAFHKQLGFAREGVRRQQFMRDGAGVDVVLFGMTKVDWAQRADGHSPMDIIDAIQAIRARNNGNWMDLLRLAFELEPQRASNIVASIYSDDAEISALAKQLARLS